MADKVVLSALVIATDEEGKHRYLYHGAKVPSEIPADEVKRLEAEGYIGPEVKLDKDEELKPEPAKKP